MKSVHFSVFVIFALFTNPLFGQNTIHLEKTVEGINDGDYGLVKKQWGFIGRVLIRKKSLRKEYAPYRERYGQLQIDTIIFNSQYNATIQLFHPLHPSKRSFLTCNLNDNGKLQGFGFGWPTLIYPIKNKYNVAGEMSLVTSQIDSIVDARANKAKPYNFNGSILVCKSDTVVYSKNVGFLNGQGDQTINDSSRFLLASVSKQFTAVGILQLMEQGLLNLDDLVCKYLPSFPYKKVRIEHLLTHTSGIPDYFSLLKKHWDPTKFASNQDILFLLAEHYEKPHFEPNASFSYSNTGYVILSLIIEKVSGKSYANFLESSIFKPLNMTHTSVYHRRKAGDTLENYAVGTVYSSQKKEFVVPDSMENYAYVKYMDCITGDDGVSSTVFDLKKWNYALSNHQLLSEKTTAAMNKSHVLENGRSTGYGYGVILREGSSTYDVEYHTGSWPGYKCIIARFKEANVQIILLSNNDYEYNESFLDEIASRLLYVN